MQELIIWGASSNGLRLKRELGRYHDFRIQYFCDNNPKKQHCRLDGLEILSFEDVIQIYRNGFCGSIIITLNEPDSVVEQIRESDIKAKVYATSYEWIHKENKNYQCAKEFMYEIDISKPRLEYYEYHISQHCNLKCKGCGHYSNIASPEFGDLEQYKRDIRRLKELYWGVKRIRLMGGEPLLNVQLPDFCTVTRETFPDANIRVVTNGLLIPSIDNEVLNTMSKSFIIFDITQYPPTSKIKEKIELKCIENNVLFSMSPFVEKFFSISIDDKSDMVLNYEKCISKKCHFLENGKISVCCMPILNEKFKDKISYRIDIGKNDVMNIYDEGIDGFVLNEFLSKPIPMCRYCDYKQTTWFEWQGNYPYLTR